MKVQDFLCKYGFHKYGNWKNDSYFHNDGWSMSFGWVAAERKDCKNCNAYRQRLEHNRERSAELIKEMNSKN